MALLALALLDPVVWAWYVTWGLVVLAPVTTDRLRRLTIVLATYWTFVGATKVKALWETIIHTNVGYDLCVVIVLVAVAIVPLSLFHQRPRRALPPPGSLAGGGGGLISGASA